MSLGLGLLSTARINAALVRGARATEGVEVVAVASRDAGRARAHAASLGVERAHGSYEALLADDGVDAVYVSLPNSMHLEWSVRALEAGKHVLCEKPMSRRAAEVEAAFDVAGQSGLVLTEAFMWRHHPQTRRLMELLPEIGSLRLIRAAFSFPLTDPGDVRLLSSLDGGALMDVGCYCVSGARLLAGADPERVAGEQVLGGDGVDVTFSGTLRFPGDVLAGFDCGFDMARRDELEAIGDEASLFLDDPWHSKSPVIELRRADGSVERVECETADPYACQLADLAAAVRGEGEPLLGRADAVGQARTIERLYASASA